MNISKKTFIFGHCRNMLRRLLPHSTKDIRFLACTVCTDSGENRKPCEALYRTRQARNLYDSFRNLTPHLISRWGGYTIKTSTTETALNGVCREVLGMQENAYTTTNTGCRLTCIHPLDRSERTNDRRLRTQYSLSLSWEGRVTDLFLPSLQNFISLWLVIN